VTEQPNGRIVIQFSGCWPAHIHKHNTETRKQTQTIKGTKEITTCKTTRHNKLKVVSTALLNSVILHYTRADSAVASSLDNKTGLAHLHTEQLRTNDRYC
jgi:hypothetical protein